MKDIEINGVLALYTMEIEGRDYAFFEINEKDLTWVLQKELETCGLLPNGLDKAANIGRAWINIEIDEETE